jgi:hypothetical protein
MVPPSPPIDILGKPASLALLDFMVSSAPQREHARR